MIIPMGTVSISRADDGAERDPIDAFVESCADGFAVIIVDDGARAMFEAGAPCEVRYTDPSDGRFMTIPCAVESIDGDRMTVRGVGDAQSANQRMSYRVNTVCSGITARVGGSSDCQIMDVSASGIRVEMNDPPSVGEAVSVSFSAFGRTVNGRFTVTRVSSETDAAQIGMAADPTDRALINALTQFTNAMQQEQLRRRSGIGSSGPGGSGIDESDPDGDDAPIGDDGWIHIPVSAMVGRALPGALYSSDGSKVAARGAILSVEEFRAISEDGLFGAENWSGEVVDRREKPRVGESGDRRQSVRTACERYVWVIALQGKHVSRMRAELIDISRGGVGLRTPALLLPGTSLVVDFSSEDESRWVIGRVTNGAIGDGEVTCRVGMAFCVDSIQCGRVPCSPSEISAWISGRPMSDVA